MRKIVVEFIGTFFLMLSIGLAIQQGYAEWTPIIVGATLTALIYAGGPISGAHYNPIISVAFWLRGDFLLKRVFPYALCQVAAAVVASFVVINWFDQPRVIISPIEVLLFPVLLAELLGTFVLAYVILGVASNPMVKNNSYYGLAIGLTVVGAAYLFGKISGAFLNPAVSIGACVMGLIEPRELWIYLVGQAIGGGVATIVFNYVVPKN